MKLEAVNTATFKVATLATGTTGGLASIVTADWALAIFGVPVSVLLAAFAGAMISLSFLSAPESLRRTLTLVSCNTLIGTYGAPLAAKSLEWNEPRLSIGLAFGIALVIQMIIPLVLQAAPKIIEALIDRIRGRAP